jgi:hypothetical protein
MLQQWSNIIPSVALSPIDTFCRAVNGSTGQVDCSPRSKINKQRSQDIDARVQTLSRRHAAGRAFICDMVNELANWAGDWCLLFPFHSKLSHLPQMHFRIRQALSYFSARAFKPFQWQEVVIIAWEWDNAGTKSALLAPGRMHPPLLREGTPSRRERERVYGVRLVMPRVSHQERARSRNFCSAERPGATPRLVRSQKNPSHAFLC